MDAEEFDFPRHSTCQVDYTPYGELPNGEWQNFQINKITCNGETVYDLQSGMVDRFDDRDLNYIASLISQDAEISNHHDRLDDLGYGPRDNEQHDEFEPREYHSIIRKVAIRRPRLDELEGEEEMFNAPIDEHSRITTPDVDYTPPKSDEEMFADQYSDIPVKTEEDKVEEEKSGDYDTGLTPPTQVIEKDMFMPLEEVKLLAPIDAEDFGYGNIDVEEGPNGTNIYKSYIMPASSKDRIELKGLLSRLYQKTNESSGGKWNKDNTLSHELQEVDKLNDLEIKHALRYYKKIDRMAGKQIQHAEGEKYMDAPDVHTPLG